MDLTHREEQDSILERLRESGGDPERVGRYVEALSRARKSCIRAESDFVVSERKVENMAEKDLSAEEVEEWIEESESEVLERYAEAEKSLEKACEIRKKMSEAEIEAADQVLKLERVEMLEEEHLLGKFGKMYRRMMAWAAESTLDRIDSLVGVAARAHPRVDAEEYEWGLQDRVTYLSGYVPYRDPLEALEKVEKERKKVKEAARRAEEQLEELRWRSGTKLEGFD